MAEEDIENSEMWKERLKLYPTVYATEGDVANACATYAVFQPPAQEVRDVESVEEAVSDSPVNGEEEESTIQTRQQSTQADIYGRIPAKEPKYLVNCSVCSRMVNTLRFAPHLDKCMGIGTTVRGAAVNARGASTR
jgi:hypothetical protein